MPLTVDFYDATGNLVVALEAQAESGPTPDSPEGPDVTESDEGGEDDDAALGVAGDEPEEFLSEQEALRESAGPGRIVGFVLLSEDARSGLRPSQPYCVGVSAYAGIAPGADVVVFGDGRSDPPDVTVLRGSALDAHEGCGMWFGVDVATADSYTISVGGFSATFNARELDENGWIVELWSDGRDRDAVCEEQMEMGTHALFQLSSSETPDRWSLPPWWRRPIQQWLILISLVFSLASCSPTGQVVEATVPNGTDSAAIEAAAAVVRARLSVIIDRDVEVVPTSEGLTIRAPDDADLALLELALAPGEISMRPVLDVLIEAPVGVSGDSGPTAEAFIEDELGVFYHLGPAFLTSDDFVDGRVEAIDFSDGTRYVVDPEFTVEGDATFLATTRMLAAYPYDDPRRQLAIVVDGLVLSAPSIASDVTPDEGISADSVILTIDRGLRTEATARAIASYLRFGPLPVVLGSS